MIYCDNSKCAHNQDGICQLTDISMVDALCVSRKKREPDIDYVELMRQSEPIGYRRGNKWVKTK